MRRVEVLDLFAGAGGASWGFHEVTDHVLGLELNTDAVATQEYAGMECYQTDIAATNAAAFQKLHGSAHLHLHASPPCTTFSAAGKGHGRNSVEVLGAAAYDILTHGFTDVDLDGIDATTRLVLEPARWIEAIRPDSISFEQVRAVLPVWEAYALGLEGIGYHVWTGLLHAEQYGVPQTRTRAWLMASREREVGPPAPTHSRYHVRNPQHLDEDVRPWVSMAEALFCGNADLVGFPRRADSDASIELDGVDYRARDFRSGYQPAFALTEKARSWTHYAPAGVSQKSHPAKPRRLDEAPAPTVTSQANHYLFNPEVDTFGENLDRGSARKITIAEASVLQGFPADYPWQGSKTSQFKQCGNAVPPPMAKAVLGSLL